MRYASEEGGGAADVFQTLDVRWIVRICGLWARVFHLWSASNQLVGSSGQPSITWLALILFVLLGSVSVSGCVSGSFLWGAPLLQLSRCFIAVALIFRFRRPRRLGSTFLLSSRRPPLAFLGRAGSGRIILGSSLAPISIDPAGYNSQVPPGGLAFHQRLSSWK